jgi:hypothetical protein
MRQSRAQSERLAKMTKVDLHVYYSTVQKDPSKDKNEKAFSNPLSSLPII